MDLSSTIHLLGDSLGQLLTEQESVEVFEIEERVRALSKARRGAGDAAEFASLTVEAAGQRLATEVAALSVETARAIAGAFALYFDLINLAEETHRVEALRQRVRELHPAPINESIAEAVALLKQRGVSREQMQGILDRLHVEVVLTPRRMARSL